MQGSGSSPADGAAPLRQPLVQVASARARPGIRRGRLAPGVVTVLGLLAAVAAGLLASPNRKLALVVGGVGLLVGALVASPIFFPLAAVPGTLLVQRVGGGGLGSSVDVSDVLLIVGTLVALPMVRWEDARTLRPVLHLALLYEAVLALSVVANLNTHDGIEWAHRLFLVGGSLVVGWVVAASGRAKQALGALLVGAAILAVVTLVFAVKLHFHAAGFGVYQKNYIGSMMWMAVVIAHLDPPWADLPRRLTRVTKYLCVAGLFAAHSKQGIIALAVVLLIAAVRLPSVRRRSKLLLASIVPLVSYAYVVASGELTSFRHHFNSLRVRYLAYQAALHIWRLHPWLGVGPRWFYLPQYAGNIQPPDIVVETLVSTGVVGLVALTVLLVGTSRVLARLPRDIGTVALAVMVGRVVESLFDIYWVSASGALPWLVAGLALGVADAGYKVARRAAQHHPLHQPVAQLLWPLEPVSGRLPSAGSDAGRR